jgi:hypothetical protein
MAVAAGVVVALGLAGVLIMRPTTDGREPPRAEPAHAEPAAPLTLAECQAAISRQTNPTELLTCGYEPGPASGSLDEPPADPNDPKYAGSSLPIDLSTNGQGCSTGPGRPVLDTVRPVLTSSFIEVPGLTRIENTFHVTRLDRMFQDVVRPGERRPTGPDATLDFKQLGTEPLSHGVSYRWRVRATPGYVNAGGWSPWCEFTIGKVTSDDLGLERDRDYTATLPVATWRQAAAVVGVWHPPIAAAAARPAGTVAVTLDGGSWQSFVTHLASVASRDDLPWPTVDAVSRAVGGPPRVTMGYPRPAA